MAHNIDHLHRRSIRLIGYDYSQAGAYFVTVCTHGRAHLFGDVVNGQMVLNDAGVIVAEEWMKSAQIRRELLLDEWIIMPNHFHHISNQFPNIFILRGNCRHLHNFFLRISNFNRHFF